MREFTPKEQELIETLIRKYQPSGVQKVFDILKEMNIVVSCEPIPPFKGKAPCALKSSYIPQPSYKSNLKWIVDDRQVCVKYYGDDECFRVTFYEILLLIIFLKKEGYIVLSRVTISGSLGDSDNYMPPANGAVFFNDLGEDLWTILDSYFVVSNALIDLAKHDFKSIEQRRFEEQLNDVNKKHKETMCKTRWALGLSFAGLVMALILPYCPEIKLAEIDEIKKEIQSIKTKIPAVIETRITNDTIKVQVVKPMPIKRNSNDTTKQNTTL